jgi:hypothetical protein
VVQGSLVAIEPRWKSLLEAGSSCVRKEEDAGMLATGPRGVNEQHTDLHDPRGSGYRLQEKDENAKRAPQSRRSLVWLSELPVTRS